MRRPNTESKLSNSQRLTLKLSEIRHKLAELSAKDDPTTEETAEQRRLLSEYSDVETRHSAALVAEDGDAEKRERETEATPDAERRERIELRGRASLTAYVLAAVQGHAIRGAERSCRRRPEWTTGFRLKSGIPSR